MRGWMNKDVFAEYREEIEAITSQLGLVCYPNHMGREIDEPEGNAPRMGV